VQGVKSAFSRAKLDDPTGDPAGAVAMALVPMGDTCVVPISNRHKNVSF
jgi:hypothetical protein